MNGYQTPKEFINPFYYDNKPPGFRPYEKPEIKKMKQMSFPVDILNSAVGSEAGTCRQCSSCHTCR